MAVEADLFPETLLPGAPDLIVFNPPWLPDAEKDGDEPVSDHLMGLASYRDPALMGRFMDGCFEQLVSEAEESKRARDTVGQEATALPSCGRSR